MLIAIMGDTFGQVMETKVESAMKERIALLDDYKMMIKWLKIDITTPAILIMKPNGSSGNDDDLEGKVEQIKMKIKRSQSDIKEMIEE